MQLTVTTKHSFLSSCKR